MDIRTQAIAATGIVHVKDLDGQPLYTEAGEPVRIIVHSPGTRQFAAAKARQTDHILKRMQDNGGEARAATPEEAARELTEFLVAVTARFENLDYDNKQGLELYEAVYSDPMLCHIPPQVEAVFKRVGNFKPGSATS